MKKSRYAAVILTALITVACDGAGMGRTVVFPSIATADMTKPPAELRATVYKPSGPGPFPGIVVLHHCGGIDGDLQLAARRLAAQGYVTVTPDSFGSRYIASVCASGAMTERQRLGDAYAAAAYLRTMPEVRADRIGVLGYSHGAGVITALVSTPPLSKPFQAAVAYYPNCRNRAAKDDVPTLILTGAKDDWTPASACQDWKARLGAAPNLDLVIYPDTWHSFDKPRTAEVIGGGGVSHHIEGNSTAAADAEKRMDAFFAKWLNRSLHYVRL